MDPFGQPLLQPDQRSCGAAVVVVARLLHDADYATYVDTPARFEQETLAVHRRVTGVADALGRSQLPWPQALGTPPWAVARELSVITDTPYHSRLVLPTARQRCLDSIEAAADGGHEVALYVGNAWLPRHVVLVLDGNLTTYDPSCGRRVTFTRERFLGAHLSIAGWSHPWIAVLPER
ncbi:hypothetical protein ncot_04190 [Nocardioides sp. JQ2195]|uniref:hypothetical protein n=1 Tax=Nocardioides sp. JQ2195 TaxID=2592334 RepID=UPI00143E1CEC|nr:hypothetical protein [Nocardioides sp. JQ2195]QIX25887.1 hypothetical protein ncot_04190 [Nocardioides sp. JQ2195]